MFMFECPQCRTTIQARDQDRGSTAVCPQCGKGIVVPTLKKEKADHAGGRHGPEASTILDPRLAEPTGQFRVSKRFGSRREKRSGNNFASFFPALLLTFLTVSLFLWFERTLGEQGAFLQKFTHRGWTPYAALLLTYWALTILVWRFADILKKDSALDVAFLTPQSRLDSDAAIDAAIVKVRQMAANSHLDALGWRIRRALEHYRTSWNIREVAEVLQEESDADYNAMASGYSLVRVFLWTIPILGFIGTVIGVGDAVGSFGTFLAQAQEIDAIKQQLTNVTSGLGTAFDTTFVGLVLSIIVMVALTAVERREISQLQAFEEYCLHNVVRRLGSNVLVGGLQSISTVLAPPNWFGPLSAMAPAQPNAPVPERVAENSNASRELDRVLKDIHGLGLQISKRFDEALSAHYQELNGLGLQVSKRFDEALSAHCLAITNQNRILEEYQKKLMLYNRQFIEHLARRAQPSGTAEPRPAATRDNVDIDSGASGDA